VFGGFVDAIGGIATIVLAVIGLSGYAADRMAAIAVIVFGAALLMQAGALLSDYAHIIFPPDWAGESVEHFGGNNVSSLFLVGAAGIVLGVLALLGIATSTLVSISIIAFGAALVLSSNSVWRLYMLKSAAVSTENPRTGAELLASEMASGSAGVQALAGLAAIVLGVLAVVGMAESLLPLSALIVLGATIVLTGSSLSGAVLSFMRPAGESHHAARAS
jgi:hypothetical protein